MPPLLNSTMEPTAAAWQPGMLPFSTGTYSYNLDVNDTVGLLCNFSNVTFNGTFFPCNQDNMTQSVLAATESPGLEPGLQFPLWLTILFSIGGGLIALLTVVGNAMVLISFYIERQLRQATNYFIASLAVTDVIIGSISIPFFLVHYAIFNYWPLGQFFCNTWLAVDYTVCLVSQYTVFFITVDRFCSVIIPAKYRGWRTDRKINIMVISCWILPTSIFFTAIFAWPQDPMIGLPICLVPWAKEPIFNTILVICYFWVTLIVMIALYSCIYTVALRLHKNSEKRQKHMRNVMSMAGTAITSLAVVVDHGKGAEGSSKHPTNKPGNLNGNTGAGEEERSSSPAFPSDTDTNSLNSSANVRPKMRRKPDEESIPLSPKDNISLPPILEKDPLRETGFFDATTDHVIPKIRVEDGHRKTDQAKEREQLIVKSCLDDVEPDSNNVWIKRTDDGGKSPHSTSDYSSSPPATDVEERNSGEEQQRPPGCNVLVTNASNGQSPNHTLADSTPTRRTINREERKSEKKKAVDQFRRGLTKIKNNSSKKAKKSKSENRARKALRTITFILGAFVVCWTPYHILVIIYGSGMQVNYHFYMISYWLCYMNSPINPFCYALANQQFKKTFKRMLRFDFRRK